LLWHNPCMPVHMELAFLARRQGPVRMNLFGPCGAKYFSRMPLTCKIVQDLNGGIGQ
jgi:hypothetical protein